MHSAPAREYTGHSAHVMNVRFTGHDGVVVSVGGNDGSIFQWRVISSEDRAKRAAAGGPGTRKLQQPKIAWKTGW